MRISWSFSIILYPKFALCGLLAAPLLCHPRLPVLHNGQSDCYQIWNPTIYGHPHHPKETPMPKCRYRPNAPKSCESLAKIHDSIRSHGKQIKSSHEPWENESE